MGLLSLDASQPHFGYGNECSFLRQDVFDPTEDHALVFRLKTKNNENWIGKVLLAQRKQNLPYHCETHPSLKEAYWVDLLSKKQHFCGWMNQFEETVILRDVNVSDPCLWHLPLATDAIFDRMHNKCVIIFTPEMNRGNLGDFLHTIKADDEFYIACILQVLLFLKNAQDNFEFVHNDLHVQNVFVHEYEEPQTFTYMLDGQKYELHNQKYRFVVWDFDYSHSFKFPGRFVQNQTWLPQEFNQYFDCHLFLNQLQAIYPIPKSVRDFIETFYDNTVLSRHRFTQFDDVNRNIIEDTIQSVARLQNCLPEWTSFKSQEVDVHVELLLDDLENMFTILTGKTRERSEYEEKEYKSYKEFQDIVMSVSTISSNSTSESENEYLYSMRLNMTDYTFDKLPSTSALLGHPLFNKFKINHSEPV